MTVGAAAPTPSTCCHRVATTPTSSVSNPRSRRSRGSERPGQPMVCSRSFSNRVHTVPAWVENPTPRQRFVKKHSTSERMPPATPGPSQTTGFSPPHGQWIIPPDFAGTIRAATVSDEEKRFPRKPCTSSGWREMAGGWCWSSFTPGRFPGTHRGLVCPKDHPWTTPRRNIPLIPHHSLSWANGGGGVWAGD